MTIKTILYIIVLPLSLWAMESFDFNKIIKINKVYQARVFYLLLSLSITYTAVNFLYDFFLNTRII